MIQNRGRLYFGIAIALSIAISLFIHLNSLLANFFPPPQNVATPRNTHVFVGMTITALVAFCTFTLNYFIIKPLHRWKTTSIKEVGLSLLLTLISVTFLSRIFFGMLHPERKIQLFQFNPVYTTFHLIISAVVLAGIFLIKALADREVFLLENERLTRENLQSRYDSLKNQLSPHFLFNSLSALKELIAENPSNAQSYVDHLSHVLRHSLQGNKNKTVSLSDELDVVQSYVYLLRMRYGPNISIENKIESSYFTYRVTPLSIQTLVENAVKHNVISKRYPLTIHLFVENEKMVVENSTKEKYSKEEGTGIGLVNLADQYALIGQGDIQIIRTDTTFRVELPLLNPHYDDSSNR